ncbi:MAG TPA: hypothetical protein VEX86_25860 [Longimicrobium sp.]|nr:hypothetical protein [Longimicrobium sp.]
MSITGERVMKDPYVLAVLEYLVRLVIDGGGYELRGVTGWAHMHDVEEATRLRMDGQLPRLFAARLVDRVNVALPGTGKESWLYRVNGAGARAHADISGEACERIRVPGEMEKDAAIYIAPGPLNALEVLRRACEEGPERFAGRGWRTGRELTLFVEQLNGRNGTDRYFRIDSMELKWLASAGLVEKRDEKLAWGRDQPVVYWRVSASGRIARVVEWREPRRRGG